MAKRDQLYTVNKWNKPFFEEEQRKRKKLYGIGGDQNDTWGFNPYVSTGNDIDVFGYGKKAGIGTVMRLPYVATQDAFVGNPYTRTNHTLDMNAVQISKGLDNPMYAPDKNTEDKSASEPKSSTSNTVGNILNTISNVADTAKKTFNYVSPTGEAYEFTPKDWGNESYNLEPKGANWHAQHGSLAAGLFQKLTDTQGSKYALSGTEGFNNAVSGFHNWIDREIATNPYSPIAKTAMQQKVANASIAKPSLLKGTTNITKSGITPLGKAGINLGASVLGKGAKYLLSNGLSTGVGEGIGTIADAASTVVQFIPGVGWAAAPIISFAGNALAGAWNGAFGSKTFDNGATAYTNRLNAINPNGSNEYIASLLASTGLGPRATYRDGWLRDKGKNEAAEINNTQDLAFNRFQRGARDAILNNNFLQTQYALNDTWSAMGGKLNRKKCNCKATGGVLNNALINSATPSGYDILRNFADIEDMKNQNSKDMNSTMGNSFMNIGGNNLFPYGGNINPLLQELMTVKPISDPEPLNLDKVLGRGDYKQYGVYPLKEVVVTGKRPPYALTENNEYPIPARYIPQSEVTAKYADSPMEAYDNSVLLESNGQPLMSGYVKVAMEPGHTRTNGNISGKQYMKGNTLYDYNAGDTILDYTDDLTGTGNALGQKLMGLPLHAADAILGYPRRHWMRNGRYYETFASGGPMIKPSHRGRLTELKKRTGKTEAELYNDGNPAHKKMVTFARNARKWKKAYGGFLDAVDNLSEIEKALYGNRGTSETRDKDNRDNFFLGGQNRYDIGGILQSAGSNWGRATETQASAPNKGYNVGDVIEIDEAEAELLKKLGYEYKIVG